MVKLGGHGAVPFLPQSRSQDDGVGWDRRLHQPFYTPRVSVILPGFRSLCGTQPPNRASSHTSAHSSVTPSSYRNPAATHASATSVRTASKSITCTSSHPRHSLVNL